MKIEYAVFTNATNPACCPDDADWYSTIAEAMSAAREAIADGTPAQDVEVLKFRTDSGDVAWNAPITFSEDGGAWSEDAGAREELGFIQGQF